MDARESFKFGFISRCIHDGVTDPGQIQGMAEKAAGGILDTIRAGKEIGSLGVNALTSALPYMLFVPPAIGAAGGHLAAKFTDIDDTDAADARRQELIDEMDRQTNLLRRRAGVHARS